MLALCKHFNLEKLNIERFIVRQITENGKTPNIYIMCFDFVKEFNILADKINTTNTYVTAKHLTTLPDNGLSLRKYGLLNLKGALDKETPLRKFLRNKKIEFDVEQKKIKILGKTVDIFRCNGNCKPCNIDKKKCSQFSQEYREAINLIYTKLYLHQSEIEVFLCGKDIELQSYSCVTRNPEFLCNVENLLEAMQIPSTISKEWAELQNGKFYVLEFDVCIKSFENIPDYIYDEKPSYDVFENYLNFLGYTKSDFTSNRIPDNFYHNLFFIKNSFEVFFNYKEKGKEYGQIFPNTKIPPSDLRISQKSLMQ